MNIGSLKSPSLIKIWEDLAKNQRYSLYVTERDIKTFRKRANNEGLSFLTRSLPSLGKALDNFHASTVWKCPDDFASQEYVAFYNLRESLYPQHIGGNEEYVKEELDSDAGLSIDTLRIPKFLRIAIRQALVGDSLAVDCVRQLTYIFYKLEVNYDEVLRGEYLDNFRKIDQDILDAIDLENSFTLQIIDHMKRIIARVLSNTNPKDVRPCHGGGATACRTPNWKKYHEFRFIPKLDETYPYSEYFFLSPGHLCDDLKRLEESATVDIPKARVVLVPKDSRGPRIISCEPAEMMYIQQGLMKLLYSTLEDHPLTQGQVNFRDQSVNRELARVGSIDSSLATIDLSDASDRVSLDLVRRVFPANWVECLEACRSEITVLPDLTEVKLNKFAPMGSSCCFPVEALVFWACAQATLYLQHRGKRWSASLRGDRILSPYDVCVYGDDIITPSDQAGYVMEGLELVGLKVNRNKSFVTGRFRESCGGDYHNGYDVTPVRLKSLLEGHGTSILTAADFVNSLITKFGYTEVQRLISDVEDAVSYVFPRTELPLPGTIRCNTSSSNDVFFRRRFNKNLQRYEHRVLGFTCLVFQRQSPNWGELLRKQLQADSSDTAGEYEHWSKPINARLLPGQYADTHSARQKWGWAWLG